MMKTKFALLAAILTLVPISNALSDENWQVLTIVNPVSGASHSLREVLRQECFKALDRRQTAFEKLKTTDDVRRWQQEHREFFLRQLGEFPARTPLRAQVVGTVAGNGYQVERVLLESQPGHHITANLYLPSTPPPHPAVIIPCGHSFNGKSAESYQRVSILMALNGIAAFCFDPIGQGERYQTFAANGKPLEAEFVANPNSLRQLESIPGHPRFNPVEEHTLVATGSILVGRNTATYRIFDGMRCIDYLVSRPDILAHRIGCTGNSGGGTLTAYLMALDDRISCAAPACYLTTFRRLLETSGPQDAEQNIFGQIEFGMDEADYVLMRAPKPTCLLAGTRDATFDIGGTWDIFRDAKRTYARFDFSERIDLVEADAPHGFSPQLRVGSTRWMRRWLLKQDDAITEPDFPIHTDEELRCTSHGQVMLLPGERSVFDLNRAEQKQQQPQRADWWNKTPSGEALAAVRGIVGVRPLDQIPKLSRQTVGTLERDDYRIEKLLLTGLGRTSLPALEFVPKAVTGDFYLYLHDEGKQADARADGPIEKLVREGHIVMALDLSGFGETSDHQSTAKQRAHWSHALFGRDGESFWLAYLLGKSLVGIRTEDVLAVGRYLEQEQPVGNRRPVHIIGIGDAGLPALHAVALESQMFGSLTLRGTLSSWKDAVNAPLSNSHLTETVHGALRTYDLPDLVRVIGADRVTIQEPQ